MSEPHSDQVVRTALQLLPVPDHTPQFWTTLDAALDAEPVPSALEPALAVGPPVAAVRALDAEPAPPVPDEPPPLVDLARDPALTVLPPALRSRSNLVLSVVAVAAAVMVVVAGLTLVQQRGGSLDTADVADGGGVAEAASTSAAVESPDSTAGDAVRAWIDALGKGDMATAWGSLAPGSRAAFGSQSAFAAEGSALAEGYGAWAGGTPDEVIVTPVASSGDGELVIVTLVGTVDQEGTRVRRAVAVPVRIQGGSTALEPFAFAGELDVVVPEPAGTSEGMAVVAKDDALVVVVPRGVAAPLVRLDAGAAMVCGSAPGTELVEVDGAAGQQCTFRPKGGIRAGQRVLTVAFVSADGAAVSARSVLFEAA